MELWLGFEGKRLLLGASLVLSKDDISVCVLSGLELGGG